MAAGKGPFIGFQYALEGVEGRSVLTDVAQVVKSKFKYVSLFLSAILLLLVFSQQIIFTFVLLCRGLFGSRSNDRQKSIALEPPESLACR